MDMKILFAGFRYKHHNKYSGYDLITKYIKGDYLDAKNEHFGFIPTNKSGKRINLIFLDYHVKRIMNNYDILHIIYGDDQIFTEYKNRNCKIVATMHLKMKEFNNRVNSLNGIITLSSEQMILYKNTYKNKNIEFIPHGFEKPLFDSLDIKMPEAINVFISGSNYRDFNTMNYIIERFNNKSNYYFHLVGQSIDIKNKYSNKQNVKVYNYVNSDEYYNILYKSDVVFLPLVYATANNVLLESQMLGKRSILPKIYGILDYGLNNNYFYNDVEELEFIFKNEKFYKYDEELSRIAYDKFSWENVSKKVINFYNKIN
jgi:glycosyltransferase involved in cell wall biosynthesis